MGLLCLVLFLQEFQYAESAGLINFDNHIILQRAIGCLASGLAFMHEQTIRHKDIKPQNILIHGGSVLYTDFGISLDFGQQGNSTTTGNPQVGHPMGIGNYNVFLFVLTALTVLHQKILRT